MSLNMPDRFSKVAPERSEGPVYPAEFHFRIITDADSEAEAALARLLPAYQVTAPLAVSRDSSAGRYRAFSLSVEMRTPDELRAFDADVKRVPGVRLLL